MKTKHEYCTNASFTQHITISDINRDVGRYVCINEDWRRIITTCFSSRAPPCSLRVQSSLRDTFESLAVPNRSRSVILWTMVAVRMRNHNWGRGEFVDKGMRNVVLKLILETNGKIDRKIHIIQTCTEKKTKRQRSISRQNQFRVLPHSKSKIFDSGLTCTFQTRDMRRRGKSSIQWP